MYYRLTHLTDDVFNLEMVEGSIATSTLLAEKEIVGLIDILEKRFDLAVHENTDAWYTN